MSDAKKPTGYVPAPQVDKDVRKRLRVVQSVSLGQMSVTDGARELGLSRLRFQTLLHRSEAAAAAALEQKPAGRKAKPAEQKRLEREEARLRRENEKMQARLAKMEQALLLAADVIQGRMETSRQAYAKTTKSKSSSSPTTESSGDSGDDEPDGARHLLGQARRMTELGLAKPLVCALVGVGASTLRRWAVRERHGERLARRRGPSPRPLDPIVAAAAASAVRRLRGLVGVEALRRSVSGLSRREATRIKHAERREMERERKRVAARVLVTVPGVIRGFDQLVIGTVAGRRYGLVSVDASVPYRTQIAIVERYDGRHVAAALERDFSENGAPLVLRLDRAACHLVDVVRAVCHAHGVILLHGPAHHPQYYGQLERGNREHRAWLDDAGKLEPDRLDSECERMRRALNEQLPRASLDWNTPATCWRKRRVQVSALERSVFRTEVYNRALKIASDVTDTKLAMRLAIEQALQRRSYLVINKGAGAN